jgi:hypothetical protein
MTSMTRSEVVDKGSAGGSAGQSCRLDRGVVVAEAAKVIGERGPSGRGVANAPLRYGLRAETAGREVAGDPAALDGPEVKRFCFRQDADVGRRRASRGGLGDLRAPGGSGGAFWFSIGSHGWHELLNRAGCGLHRGRAEQGDVEVRGDGGGGRRDAFSDGLDSCLRPGAGVAAGPARHVRPRGCRGVEAEVGSDDEDYGVGLDLLDTTALRCGGPRWVRGRVVHEDMAEFMGQRPGNRSVAEAGTDPDASAAPAGQAVGAAILALDSEAFPPGEPGEGIPEPSRRTPRNH